MKIIPLAEFLDSPPNTVFFKYEPCILSDFGIFMSRCNRIDFFYVDLTHPVSSDGSADFVEACEKAEHGESIRTDFEIQGRDGLFEEKQLYAVLEKQDIEELIERLKKCL